MFAYTPGTSQKIGYHEKVQSFWSLISEIEIHVLNGLILQSELL